MKIKKDGFKSPVNEKRENIENIVKIATGIKELDEFLGGGIWVGHTTAITSPENTGKTTLLIKIMMKAAQNDIPTAYLLGEDGDGTVMDKAIHMTGGRFALTAKTDKWGRPYNDICPICENKIRTWLDGYMLNMDDDSLPINNFDDVCRKITDFSNELRLGGEDEVGLVLLDNLMLLQSMVVNDSDINSRQSKVCKTIARLAKKLKNVAIILVAHARKEMFGFNAENINDNISGSADIKNSLSCIINWRRDPDDYESNHRFVTVSKNRVNGRLHIREPFIVDYDEDTYTLYSVGDVDEQFFEYAWLTDWKKQQMVTPTEKQIIQQESARVAREKAHAEECAKLHREQMQYEKANADKIRREDERIKQAKRQKALTAADKILEGIE